MATAVNPVTQQTKWTYPFAGANQYFDDTDALSDPETYAFSTSAWASGFTAGSQRVVITPADDSNNLALKFIGDPAGVSFATTTGIRRGVAAIWGVSELFKSGSPDVTEYLAEFLGRVDLTVGTVPATGSGILPSSTDLAYFCSRIDVAVDTSLFPGMRVVGQQENAAPVLLIDSMGYDSFIIEMKCLVPSGPITGQSAADQLAFVYRVF